MDKTHSRWKKQEGITKISFSNLTDDYYHLVNDLNITGKFWNKAIIFLPITLAQISIFFLICQKTAKVRNWNFYLPPNRQLFSILFIVYTFLIFPLEISLFWTELMDLIIKFPNKFIKISIFGFGYNVQIFQQSLWLNDIFFHSQVLY